MLHISPSQPYSFDNPNRPDVGWRKQIAKVLCVLSVTTAVYTLKHDGWRRAVNECLLFKCHDRLGAPWRNETVLTNKLPSWPSTLVPRGEPCCFYRQGTLCMTSYCTPALTNRYTRLSTPRCNYSQAESEKFPSYSKWYLVGCSGDGFFSKRTNYPSIILQSGPKD